MLNILLTPLGSAGDVHPFAGLGAELRARGHRVTLLTSGTFSALAAAEGFEFCDVMNAADYQAMLSNPNIWSPLQSYLTFYRAGILPTLRSMYRAIVERHVPGQTVVVAPGHALGARIACEKLGIPLATVHLAPFQFRSVFQNRRLARIVLPDWMPAGMKRAGFWLGDRVCDRIVGPTVNGFRAELDLPRVRRIIWHWWNSPQLIVAMFPPWFAAPQPDWPAQTRVTGFPLYDGKGNREMSPELSGFLADGEPPVVFTPGSGIGKDGPKFFRISLEACQKLGYRAVLVTRYRDQLPATVPDWAFHAEFAPFQSLFPRARAVVHHCGIGTTAQAIAAGIPQLARPMTMDQPDNAYRLSKLGVALGLSPRQYRVAAVVRVLERLSNNLEIKAACRHWADEARAARPIGQACDHVEQLAKLSPAAGVL